RVTATIDLLHHRLGDTPSIEELADAVGLRPSYFREEFRNETGFSPVEFLTRLRVREARRLLAESEQSITEIAFRLGFNSSQYFAATFRKHTGMTPREFRRQATIPSAK
ncbi:MAG: helix-turn-helix transcriptional regulator, partial [Verrucomicrobia bacterium]|nr:helix-turn-helix transcriptional regulator [Verrucomicrobiota bacterium]